MVWTKPCRTCGADATIAIQPEERRRFLPRDERPSPLPTTREEWRCPNGHVLELTYYEVRKLE